MCVCVCGILFFPYSIVTRSSRVAPHGGTLNTAPATNPNVKDGRVSTLKNDQLLVRSIAQLVPNHMCLHPQSPRSTVSQKGSASQAVGTSLHPVLLLDP